MIEVLAHHYPDCIDMHHQLGDLVEAALNMNIPRLAKGRPSSPDPIAKGGEYTHQARLTKAEVDATPAANERRLVTPTDKNRNLLKEVDDDVQDPAENPGAWML